MDQNNLKPLVLGAAFLVQSRAKLPIPSSLEHYCSCLPTRMLNSLTLLMKFSEKFKSVGVFERGSIG